jgi:hypothetical protein
VFRGIPDPTQDGVFRALWPDPRSQYALILRDGVAGWIPGVPYCAACPVALYDDAPDAVRQQVPDATWVAGVETALERYTQCFDETFGQWLGAWLLGTGKTDPAPYLAQWRQDRHAGLRPDQADRLGSSPEEAVWP